MLKTFEVYNKRLNRTQIGKIGIEKVSDKELIIYADYTHLFYGFYELMEDRIKVKMNKKTVWLTRQKWTYHKIGNYFYTYEVIRRPKKDKVMPIINKLFQLAQEKDWDVFIKTYIQLIKTAGLY